METTSLPKRGAIQGPHGTPDGEREVIYDVWEHESPGKVRWAAPQIGSRPALELHQLATLKIWEAEPGEYEVVAAERPDVYEVKAFQAGSITIYPDGEEPVTLSAPSTYVFEPGFNGKAIVHDRVVAAFFWIAPGTHAPVE